MKNLIKNKKGVFGLTAVQSFFAIILGLALLAYVIIIIMGTLSTSSILTPAQASVINETGAYLNTTGYTLAQASTAGFSAPSITAIYNASSKTLIPAANYTLTGNILTNATATTYTNVTVSYTYNYNTAAQNNANQILTNTSSGVTSFFSSINPVWAILAILVIILVLVVLVRVVQSPNRREGSTQL